jgi:hypothetical protein
MKIYYLLIPVALSAGFFTITSKTTISQTPQAFAEEYLANVKTKGQEMDRKEICRKGEMGGGLFYSLAPLTSYTIKQVIPKKSRDLDYHELTADVTTTLTQGGVPQRQESETTYKAGQLSNGTWGPIASHSIGKSIYPPVPVNVITLQIWKSDDYYKKHKLTFPGITRELISKNTYCIAYPRNWSNSIHGKYISAGELSDLSVGILNEYEGKFGTEAGIMAD